MLICEHRKAQVKIRKVFFFFFTSGKENFSFDSEYSEVRTSVEWNIVAAHGERLAHHPIMLLISLTRENSVNRALLLSYIVTHKYRFIVVFIRAFGRVDTCVT